MTHPHTHKEEPPVYNSTSVTPVLNMTVIEPGEEPRSWEEEVEEFLKKLPDEFIIHDYMEKQGDGLSKDYCEGWNDYRGEIIRRLTPKTEIR